MKRKEACLRVGQPYNPFGMFNGIWIPEALVRSQSISAGAKLTFGRLTRYAGQGGHCYPAVPTLAAEIGVGPRQAQKYLAELERAELIRRVNRFSGRGQTTNAVEFLWHTLFEQGVNDRSGEGVNNSSSPPVNDRSPKESHVKESHCEETNDIDCLITNRKNRDSQPGDVLPPSQCRQYPQLRELLAKYMVGTDLVKIYPRDRHVVGVMDAAGGATEDQVMQCLVYLYNKRGLKPGTRNGPRHFSWFPTVVGDYFQKVCEREAAANPSGYDEWSDRNETMLSNLEMKSMTDAIEIDDSAWKVDKAS